MEIDFEEFTENQLTVWNGCQSFSNLLVDAANYRASDEGLYSVVIDKGSDEKTVIINHMLDALWTAEEKEMDLVPLIHSMVLRITFSLETDEQHDKMKELLNLLDEKYGNFP